MTTPAPPLAVYAHWPYCARICPYCDFNVVRDRGQAEQVELARAIVRDLAGQAAMIGERQLVSVFLGGGTPSLMRPEWVADIIEQAKALWPPGGPIEVTLEANPTDADAGRFAAFADAGVTRLSLGAQAFDDDALKLLGRNHDAAEATRAAKLARSLFQQLSIDLIYALPGQTPAAWREAVLAALTFEPDHVSPYQLTIEPGTAFDRQVSRGDLIPPDADTAAGLYETTQAVLEAQGFTAYEVSNHARGPAARSRHNLAYWRGWDYVGAGPGAHGRLTLDQGRLATTAARRPADYIKSVAATGVGLVDREMLSPREAAIERLLMGLRICEGAPFADLAPLGLGPDNAKVADFTQLGLIAPDPARLRATPAGRAVLNRLIEELAHG